MAREKLFENKIKQYLDKKGAYYFKFFANAYTKAGIPDIIVCLNGKFIGIEVKREEGKPSELQEYNLKKINDCGGYGILIYPSGFEKFKKELEYFMTNNLFVVPNCNGYIKFKRGWYE